MKALTLLCALVVAAVASVSTQAPAAPPPYVASPMRKTVDDTQRRTGFQPGTFVMAGGTIRSIFQLAYPSEGIDPIGEPDWFSTERFDLSVASNRSAFGRSRCKPSFERFSQPS